MTDDRERLERYLEWQHGADRRRAQRRRRWLRSTAVAISLGGVIGVGVWLMKDSPPRRDRASTATAPEIAAPAAVAPIPEWSPPGEGRVAPPKRPARPLESRSPQRSAPRLDSPVVPPWPAAGEPAETPEVAAAVAPSSPASVHPGAPPEALVATPDPAMPVPPAQAEVAPEPTPPALPPSEPAPAPAGAAPPTASERVTSWVKGEVQEFRDGVKREIAEFRSGVEKVRGAILRRTQ